MIATYVPRAARAAGRGRQARRLRLALAAHPEPEDAAIWAIERTLERYPVSMAIGWIPTAALLAAALTELETWSNHVPA